MSYLENMKFSHINPLKLNLKHLNLTFKAAAGQTMPLPKGTVLLQEVQSPPALLFLSFGEQDLSFKPILIVD